MLDTVKVLPTFSYEDLFAELGSMSQSHKGCPKLVTFPWVNSTYLRKEILVLPLNSGGTEVAASPIAVGTDWLNIKHHQAPLALYPDSDGYVDSSEVLRSFNTYLSTITDYAASEVQLPLIQLRLKHSETPAPLLLAIPVDNRKQERIYYLVADGQGNWKRVLPQDLEPTSN